jgi:3-oxoacyl-[acyl-carrier protein] reductase
VPIGRFGEASEIAAAVALLASDRAGYITGATIDMNGGLFMR